MTDPEADPEADPVADPEADPVADPVAGGARDPAAQPAVRPARPADHDAMTRALAGAFADDPVVGWVLPPDVARRGHRLRALFAMELPRSAARGGAWAAADGAAAALWHPPGHWRPTWGELLTEVPAASGVFGRHLPRALRVMTAMERAHPTAPHWYLCYLGTAPHRQGRGTGSALLRPVLARCDREQVGAYLEASTERSRSLYQRHGFSVVGELRLPGGGPPVRRMWRDPR